MAKTLYEHAAAYLDSMPTRSRVNYDELIQVVLERASEDNAKEDPRPETAHLSASSWTKKDWTYANQEVHRAVNSRDDVLVQKGRGIWKR